jgi:hypothetical protein
MFRSIVVASLLIVSLCGVAVARRIAWRPQEKPPVSLQDALRLADKEVGKKQDKEVKYHCIGASIAKTFTNGDWGLRYCSDDGSELWVSVGSDKSVRVSADGFEY